MASLAANASPDQGRRVRPGAAPPAGTCRPAKPVCFLSTERSYTFRDRARQRRFAMACRFRRGRQAEGVDTWLKEPLPISALRPVHLSPRGSDHSRRLTDLRGVCLISRKAIFSARKRRKSLSMFRRPAHFGAKWQAQADLCRWAAPHKGLRSGIACSCSPFAKRYGAIHRGR